MRTRRVLVGAAAVVAVLLAVGIPWTISAVRPDSTPAPQPERRDGAVVADRLGPAYELVTTERRAVQTGDAVSAAGSADLARAEQRFSLDLLRALRSSGNLAVSPASLAQALAMVEHGARGATLSQIEHALHTSALGADGQGRAWQELLDNWSGHHRDVSLHSANSVWTDRALRVRPAFLTDLDRYYHAGVWQVDFVNDRRAAVDAINAWTARTTHGRIPKLFDELPPETKAVLANAIYFKAAWQSPFDPHDTADGRFTSASGPVSAKFMNTQVSLPAAVDPNYTAVELPYRGGRFAALAIMPASGSLSGFVDRLSAEQLDAITSGLRRVPIQLRMPRFTISETMNLNAALSALGVRDAFTDAADFSELAEQPLEIDKVVQRVYLSVGEKGTEAAAATGVVMVPTSARAVPPTQITLDHPFLFLIRDTRTGAILFASQVNNPA